MSDKNGWIDKTGWIGTGVEDFSQTTGDWVGQPTGDIASNGFGEG